MTEQSGFMLTSRRRALQGGVAAGASVLAAPYLIRSARAADALKIGVLDPQTGTYAALGGSEIIGAQMAAAAINDKGGVLGRQVELVIEDTAANAGTAVQKANKLIDRDGCDFLIGAVSSAVALAISQTAHDKGKVYVITGGHADDATGKSCHWSTFRICNTTYTLAEALTKTMFDKFGKKWYFITPDYAFGHSLQGGMSEILKKLGGQELGNALAPLGTTDFSSYLIKAKAANPQVLIAVVAGDDLVNMLKQANQFGMTKDIAIGVPLGELEVVAALPEAARVGYWTFEWYWNQPDVPDVAKFVAAHQKFNSGKVPSARTWFGYAAVHALALGADKAKSTEGPKVARALEGMVLPPEVALEPGTVSFDKSTHQLRAHSYPGKVISDGKYPNLLEVLEVVPADHLLPPEQENTCKLDYPA
jgi:branched-chain amino acid transport system substrate-binding protein